MPVNYSNASKLNLSSSLTHVKRTLMLQQSLLSVICISTLQKESILTPCLCLPELKSNPNRDSGF